MKNKIILFFLLCNFHSFSQRPVNRYKNLERNGLWIVYQDSAKKQIDNIGRYRKGIPKGTWKYYDPEGKLVKKEKNVFRKIYTRYYHPNGKVQKKGKAKTIITDKLIHYYYYGNWYTYDSTGQLIKKQVYSDGNKISEICFKITSEQNLNDSLVEAVRGLEKQLTIYRDSLQIAEQNFGKNSKQYERYASLNNLNALKVLSDIEEIIKKFDYPGKSLVGKEYSLVFSIISSASITYKQKYYDVIIEAADKGELDWADVAFFVDKVKVAKKEKQVYGTQYRLIDNKILYYPILEKSQLNARRKKIGLEEMDLQLLDDTANY